MESLLHTTQPRRAIDTPLPPSPITFSTGASTDDDGVPQTPPDTHFLVQRPKSTSVRLARRASRSPPPSTILEIALSNSSLTPFTYRPLSRSPSPPPSPPPISAARQLRTLPAGFEHIPWISSDEEDDSDDGLLSRSLSPPLHEFLSLPALSPDFDDDAGLGVGAPSLGKAKDDEDLPPSPPRTPSPRTIALPLPPSSSTAELPWASSSPERSASTSPSRRPATRSSLPPLRTQLSPSPPSASASSPPSLSSRSRSAPPSPTKPNPRASLALALPSLAPSATARRRSASLSPTSPPASPRSRASLALPPSLADAEPPRGRSSSASSSSERGRSRGARRAGEEGTSRVRRGEDCLAVEDTGDRRARWGEEKSKTRSRRASDAYADGGQGGLQLLFAPEPGGHADNDNDAGDDADDPSTLAFFENNTHSLPLLRLRHALSLAAVYASLAPSSPSASRSPSSRRKDAPRLPSSGAYAPSSRGAVTPVVGNMVSQQYRLYAMGRAKAQRTGGVGYWEGGINAWELLLME
ncbi:hypothetical protein JCM10450v2_005404 [Rhodotorula kratochvilovae]